MSFGKALYIHGFLGDPNDMRPLFLNGYECESFDVRSLLNEESPIEVLSEKTSSYQFAVGYSFGGRLLEELKEIAPEKSKLWFFVSSRHSPYSKDELVHRELFREKLVNASYDLEAFFEIWNTLPLFSGHKMDEYRQRYKLAFTPWTPEEIRRYLDLFFQSRQFIPKKCNKSYYLYGDSDEKYSGEAEVLKNTFRLSAAQGGHRFLFEQPDKFKLQVHEFLKASSLGE